MTRYFCGATRPANRSNIGEIHEGTPHAAHVAVVDAELGVAQPIDRTMPIKSLVQKFLSERPHNAGETVQFGWFIFRIAEPGRPPRVESLDFRQLASFTEDFSEAERIYALQLATLPQFKRTECPCTLRQFALISLSYTPERDDVFIERQQAADGNDSGWYVGVYDESRDMNDAASFTRRSLYELTIHNMRLAAFWLLPPGTLVPLKPR